MTRFIQLESRRSIFMLIAIIFAISLCSEAQETKGSAGTNDAHRQGASGKRDPFWPVGYVPEGTALAMTPKADKAPATKKPRGNMNWNNAMKKIAINGVSSRANNEFFAVINGQIKSTGDTVTINHEGVVYTWVVDGIKPPGSVKLRRVSAK